MILFPVFYFRSQIIYYRIDYEDLNYMKTEIVLSNRKVNLQKYVLKVLQRISLKLQSIFELNNRRTGQLLKMVTLSIKNKKSYIIIS